MKKLILIASIACLAVTGSANAVVPALIGTDTGGTISVGADATVGGRAIVVSTTAEIAGDIPTAFDSILTSGGSSGDFDAALSGLIGADPTGQVFDTTFAGGTLFFNTGTSGGTEVGPVGNNTYLFLVAETGGQVDGIGAFQGGDVVALGSIIYSPAGTTAALGSNGGGGFALAEVNAVPEPTVALLGALGVLGMLRRRR